MKNEKIEFYDREEELSFLKEKHAQVNSTEKGVMIALYGRRRVGKTELVKKFLETVKDTKLYFYVGLTERNVAYNMLAESIREQTGDSVRIDNSDDFYKYINTKAEQGNVILIFDEFQRFLDISP